MKLRVENIRRELTALRGSKTAAKGGVMIVPLVVSAEEWEAEAEPVQRALMEWSMEAHSGADVRDSLPEPMTADQERAFVHQMEATRRQGKSMTVEQRATQAYAKATGLFR